jgi:hypothetical protein
MMQAGLRSGGGNVGGQKEEAPGLLWPVRP